MRKNLDIYYAVSSANIRIRKNELANDYQKKKLSKMEVI